MIRLTNSLKLISKRSFCKKPELLLKKEKWFDRHVDPNLVKINDLTFKNIDLEIEIMTLKIKIKELDTKINKMILESNISRKK
jgi:hypothetical protein